MTDEYRPIRCSFHDQLEAWCVTKTRSTISYRDEHGRRVDIEGLITDITVKDGEEFLVVDGAPGVRLDRLIAVNGRDPASD